MANSSRGRAGVSGRTRLPGLLAVVLATMTLVSVLMEGSAAAAGTRSGRVRIHWIDNGVKFLGEGDALAIRGDTLYFSSVQTRSVNSSRAEFVGTAHGVYIPDLDRMEIIEGTRGRGGLGALIGGGIGLLMGFVIVQGTQGDVFLEAPASTIPVSAGIGALLRAAIGAVIRTSDTREVSREELERLLGPSLQ